jgi:hypothetical protein
MKKIIRGLLLLMLVTPTASRAMSGGAVDGQVLDYDSGEPVEGAIVVARWQGELFQIVQSQGVCVHAETVVSGARGRYHIEAWAAPTVALGGSVGLDVYKQGYVSAHGPLGYVSLDGRWVVFRTDGSREIVQTFPDQESAKAATHPNDLYLKRFTGTSAQRFEYIRVVVFTNARCFEAGPSQRNLYPLAKTAFQEAKALATTPDQIRSLRFMRVAAIDTWLALPGTTTGTEAETAASRIPEEIRRDLQ